MKIAIWSLVIAALLPAPTNPTTAVSIVTTGFQAGQAIRDCSNCPEIVIVPAGSFTMGSPASEPERDDIEGPQRQVSVRQFAVGKFDVTRGQWAAFVRATTRRTAGGCAWAGPSNEKLDPRLSWQKLGFVQDDTHPVVCVSWQDTQDYSHWLSKQTGHKYRLLSEAEWEYAARGGTATTSLGISRIAWPRQLWNRQVLLRISLGTRPMGKNFTRRLIPAECVRSPRYAWQCLAMGPGLSGSLVCGPAD